MPLPDDPELRAVTLRVGVLQPTGNGLTLGYAIFIKRDQVSDRLIRHECRHVAQYEQAGGIADFLPVYLGEVLAYGYQDAAIGGRCPSARRGTRTCRIVRGLQKLAAYAARLTRAMASLPPALPRPRWASATEEPQQWTHRVTLLLEDRQVELGALHVDGEKSTHLLHLAHLNLGILLTSIPDRQSPERAPVPANPVPMFPLGEHVPWRARVQHGTDGLQAYEPERHALGSDGGL